MTIFKLFFIHKLILGNPKTIMNKSVDKVEDNDDLDDEHLAGLLEENEPNDDDLVDLQAFDENNIDYSNVVLDDDTDCV